MFKLLKLLSLSTALSILQVSAQNDMEDIMANDMANLSKIIECIDLEGSSIIKDDCTCNDIKGIVDMPVAAAPFEEAGLPLDLFTKCCLSEETTNEEFTECTANEVNDLDIDSLTDQIPDSDSLSEDAAGSEDAGEEAPSDTDATNTDNDTDGELDETTETNTDALIEEEEVFYGEEENSGMNYFGSSSLVVLGMGTILASLF